MVCLAGQEGPMCGQLLGESTVPILEVLVVYTCCHAAILLWLSVGCGDVPCFTWTSLDTWPFVISTFLRSWMT